ncbi:MAG: pyridoxamine 5'-phosphate oxidase family protein [Bacteroidales bacterium]|nr:pyridoxamine 5'-phosphate oxidase family protein [Bacteroidales bacterium]
MRKALDFLQHHNEVAFATCEGNLPKIRVFQIMKQENTTLYFATSPQKNVYKELKNNPNIEILANADKIAVRCTGVVNFEVTDDIQQWIYKNNEVLSRLYTNYQKLTYFSLKIKAMDYYDLNPTPPIMLHFDLENGITNGGFVGEKFGMYKI